MERRGSAGCRWRGAEGIGLVEVLVAMVLLTVGILAVASFATTSSRDMNLGRRDLHMWSAVQQKLEELSAEGHASVASGSDTVAGHAITWTVSGTNPKKVILTVISGPRWSLPRPDSFVLYVAK